MSSLPHIPKGGGKNFEKCLWGKERGIAGLLYQHTARPEEDDATNFCNSTSSVRKSGREGGADDKRGDDVGSACQLGKLSTWPQYFLYM